METMTIIFVSLGIFFLLHLIGDFIFQNRYLAINKSRSVKVLTYHVGLYITPFIVLFPLLHPDLAWVKLMTFSNYLWFIGLLFVTHWITDFFTSKLTTYFYLKEKYKYFFDTIGVDQWIHTITLLALYYYFILPYILKATLFIAH